MTIIVCEGGGVCMYLDRIGETSGLDSARHRLAEGPAVTTVPAVVGGSGVWCNYTGYLVNSFTAFIHL